MLSLYDVNLFYCKIMYKSLKEFYDSAEFFPVGRIVPRRILKVERKLSHRFKFASDTWFIQMRKGHLLVSDDMRPNSQGCVIRAHGDFNKKKTLKVKMCPYVAGGAICLTLTGSFAINHPYETEVKLLEHINKVVKMYS